MESVGSSILNEIKKLLPQLVKTRYKGQNGKIGVIGGSFEYTGAPYYAAISSLYAGADLAHIFCTESAAIPIKSYSPECIVHPSLNSKPFENTYKWFPALHSIVIGPGLGRNEAMLEELCVLLDKAYKSKLTIVYDADMLWYLTLNKAGPLIKLMRENSIYTILTPNAIEFNRLWQVFIEEPEPLREYDESLFQENTYSKIDLTHPLVKNTAFLSRMLSNVIILEKGRFEIITNGKDAFYVNMKSSLKRCGGIGDVLSGNVALFAYYGLEYHKQTETDLQNSLMYSCIGASLLTKLASHLAFEEKKRSLTAPFVALKLSDAFQQIFNLD